MLDAIPDGMRATWQQLDAAFCAYPDDLTTLMRGFVAAHRAELRPWP